MGIIASGSTPESLAGIMGGAATAVTLDTVNIYVEAAFWWPESIAGRARKLKLSSEASHRFERGVDFQQVPEHLDRITGLILQVCGGQAGPIDDQCINMPERQPVTMRLSRCQRVLGIPVTHDQVTQTFTRLGFVFDATPDKFVVSPPSFRFDIAIEEDLIEEVARIIGFDNIPANPPLATAVMRHAPETERSAHTIRAEIAGLDYQEVINFSFVEEAWEHDMLGTKAPIRLLNPIASQLAVMRTSLLPGLVANIRYNANRKQSRVRVFELGRVFTRQSQIPDGPLTVAGIHQPQRLAGAAWGYAGPDQWAMTSKHVDFYDVKRDVETLLDSCSAELRFASTAHPLLHPGRSAEIFLKDSPIGLIGELHPKWVQQQELGTAPVLFELAYEVLRVLPMPKVRELSKQPTVQRDLAIWVSTDKTVQSLLDTIKNTISEDPSLSVVQQVQLFDQWRDPSKEATQEKSLAFRLTLQDTEITLDDARVDGCVSKIRQALETVHHARPR
jgi:phenylalanyl-tRNA synthetase beta chain